MSVDYRCNSTKKDTSRPIGETKQQRQIATAGLDALEDQPPLLRARPNCACKVYQ